MNKLLQNVNLAGTSLFLQILGVSHQQAFVQSVPGVNHCRACSLHAQQEAVRSVCRLYNASPRPLALHV
jgi:hypothetical protein